MITQKLLSRLKTVLESIFIIKIRRNLCAEKNAYYQHVNTETFHKFAVFP